MHRITRISNMTFPLHMAYGMSSHSAGPPIQLPHIQDNLLTKRLGVLWTTFFIKGICVGENVWSWRRSLVTSRKEVWYRQKCWRIVHCSGQCDTIFDFWQCTEGQKGWRHGQSMLFQRHPVLLLVLLGVFLQLRTCVSCLPCPQSASSSFWNIASLVKPFISLLKTWFVRLSFLCF